MVPFIDVEGMSEWIAEEGLEGVLLGMVDGLEEDFRRWPAFNLAERVADHSPLGVIELMPTSDGETYGCKYVNGHPGNPARGLQTVTAFGFLADVATGYPTFLAEMTLLTALRTAATSAMAARALARPRPASMALLGTGSQAEFQAVAMRAVLGVDRLAVWDIDPDAMRKLRRNLEPLGFEVRVAASAADAADGADIITTCTADKANATVLTDAMVRGGVHVNAIGGDCPGKTELEAAILPRAAVFVEYEPQTRVEGKIQQVGEEVVVTELWRVLTGLAPGRTGDEQVTVFDSVGFAVEDFSALRYVRNTTHDTAHVRGLDLVAAPRDPKDLFALLQASPVAAGRRS